VYIHSGLPLKSLAMLAHHTRPGNST